MELSTVYQQSDNIVTRKVMDETLLVPITGNLASMDEIYTLNDMGALIWNSLDGSRSLAAIGRKIEQQYDAPLSVIEADMVEIITGLKDAHLIKVAQGDAV